MTRPHYLPTPAIEILRREIPGLPWESPSGADVSTAEGWVASINEAIALTPSGALTCARHGDRWRMERGDMWCTGSTPAKALDRLLERITHAGKIYVPDIIPDVWPPLLIVPIVGLILASTALAPWPNADPLGTLLRALASVLIFATLGGWLSIRTLRSVSARRHRRALAIAELMRRPLPWLATAKGPQAEAGSLSLTP